MADVPAWLDIEDRLCNSMVEALTALATAEAQRERSLSDELRSLLEQRRAACDDALQQASIDQGIDELERARAAHKGANRVRKLDLARPYFGHLTLVEQGKTRELLIGKGSAVHRELPCNIVDWRNAPISKLYYEYEEGDEWEEVIAERDREGTIEARRTLDIRAGVLQGAESPELMARKRAGGVWQVKRRSDEVLQRSDRREDPDDHALPDIVALITPEQFAVLTRPDSGVVVLQGQAGSGKTTVALHRIAYLRYQDPERFRPERVLVVMFNKALQVYIKGALAELDIGGVRVATFHGWARGMLQRAGLATRFAGGAPRQVTLVKQHPSIEALLAAKVRQLGRRLEAWMSVPEALNDRWQEQSGEGIARIMAFFDGLSAQQSRSVQGLHKRVRSRLSNHARDLYGLFDDEELVAEHLPSELVAHLHLVASHQERCRTAGTLDFADAALLLRLGQLVEQAGGALGLPWWRRFAHVVVDEAQDLSAPAIRVLLDAADERRSVTLAGDPAQTLYEAGSFGLMGAGTSSVGETLKLDHLRIGHRSTRPILELALRASGRDDPALLRRTRPGLPVIWLTDDHATPNAVADAIAKFRADRPKTLVAVLCRTKADRDRWFSMLCQHGVANLRTGHRDTFSFEPGTVVSNVHQVKGLEFDGVVLIEPRSYGERDRNLLHVAITRAADQLWIVGEPGMLRP